MAQQLEQAEITSHVKGRHKMITARDTEWYKKRRDEVPAINRAKVKENPFKHLLKSNGSRSPSSVSQNSVSQNKDNRNSGEQG